MSATAKAAAPEPQWPTMTLEEFLAWDGGGHAGKLELWNGVVRALAPASATHAIIQGNIVTAFNIHLRSRQSPWRAGTEAPVVPPMAQRRNARAPDVAVTCTPPAGSTFDDPVLIVEVLSPGNEDQTWDSIQSLAGLVSLKEVLVVQSTQVHAELFRRGADGAWPREGEAAGRGGEVRLATIDLVLPVTEIYQGTALA
jgi:Uma2 family endonuclease